MSQPTVAPPAAEPGSPAAHVLDDQFYVFREGGAIGPLLGSKLVEMVAAGGLPKDAPVNRLGEPDWKPLDQFPMLSPFVATAASWPQKAPPSKSRTQYADFWIRLGAYLIDYLLLIAISAVIGFLVGLMATLIDGVDGAERLLREHTAILQLVGVVTGAVYYGFFVSGPWQATPGKRLCGIRVVREDGGRIDFTTAVLRYFAYLLSALILFIGFLMIFWTDQRKALHDIICRTRVVRGNL